MTSRAPTAAMRSYRAVQRPVSCLANTTRPTPRPRASTRFHSRSTARLPPPPLRTTLPCTPTAVGTRCASTSPTADALMEGLTELYATARDEFEIAAEETAKKSTYGAEDRAAAHEAFGVLRAAYDTAVGEGDERTRKEVERRVGPRLRELESALANMDALALEE